MAPSAAPQMGGLLGGMPQAPAAPQQGMPGSMPPELMKAIQQVKMGPPDQKMAFMEQITKAIQSAPDKTPEAKKMVLEEFMKAMS